MINIYITSLTAERLIPPEANLGQGQVQVQLTFYEVDVSEGTMKAKFNFTANYIPPVAQITVKGEVKMKVGQEKAKEIKKTKQVPHECMQAVIQALTLESVNWTRALKIPPLIPLPTLSPKKSVKHHLWR